MDKKFEDEILFSLCFAQIVGLRKTLGRKTTKQSKEAAAAWLKIGESLYELACAAAVRSHISRESTDSLVMLMDDVRNHLQRTSVTK